MTKAVDFIKGELGRRMPKKAQLINMLHRKAGEDAVTIGVALGWKSHTTRAAISRLRGHGYVIESWVPVPGTATRYRIIADSAVSTAVEAGIAVVVTVDHMQARTDAA